MKNKNQKLLKEFTSDFVVTMLSSVLLIGLLQLAIYPFLASYLSSYEYGLFLFIIAGINIVMPSLGSTLCNTRITLYAKYRKTGVQQTDFGFILKRVIPIVAIIFFLVSFFVYSGNTTISLLVGLLAVLSVIRAYFLVVYRLHFDSKMLLLVNGVISAGYLIGLLVVLLTGLWPLVFIIGEVSALIFFFFKTDIFFEKNKKSSLFQDVKKTYSALVLSNLINYLANYIDRLLLLPFFGAASVSVYYAATFFGKAFSFLIAPVSSVLLGYLGEGRIRLNIRKFVLINLMIITFGVVVAALVSLLWPIVANFLYPSFYQEAYSLMIVGNAASVVSIMNALNLIIILKFAPAKWQIVISLVRLLMYFISFVLAAFLESLYSLCIFLLLSGALVFVFSFFVGIYYISKGENIACTI